MRLKGAGVANLFFPNEEDRAVIQKIVQVLNLMPSAGLYRLGSGKPPWAQHSMEVWCLTVCDRLCIHVAGAANPTVHVSLEGQHDNPIDVTGADGPWVKLVRERLPDMLKEVNQLRREEVRKADELRAEQLQKAREVFK